MSLSSLFSSSFDLYILLLSISIGILLIIWILELNQLCLTQASDAHRIRVIFLALLWTTLSIISNGLIYSSAIYPDVVLKSIDVKLSDVSVVFESLYMMIGFHIFRLFHLFMIDQLYSSTNQMPPKVYQYLFNILEFIVIIMVSICYSFVFIFPNINWIIIWYIILSVIVIIVSSSSLYALSRILNILNSVQMVESANNAQVKYAKCYIKAGYIVESTLALFSIYNILVYFQILINIVNISFNHSLIILVGHSVICIGLSVMLLLRVFQSYPSCNISKHSVCAIHCSCCYGSSHDYMFTTRHINNNYQIIGCDTTTTTNQITSTITTDNSSIQT
eukprot:157757_1